MFLLAVGVSLFAAVHLFPAALTAERDRVASRMGSNAYRGVFSLLILASVVTIVVGWKTAAPGLVYLPPLSPGPIVSALILIALLLFVAAALPSNIKRLVRHPQLTGVTLWSGAHLLANGDNRSLILFGGLGTWAIIEIVLCNRRDGAWVRANPVSVSADVTVVATAVAAFVAIAYFHRWLFGVSAWRSLPSW